MTVLSFLSSFLFFDKEYEKRNPLYGQEHIVNGTVTSVRYENNFSSGYIISIDSVDGSEDKHKAVLQCEYSAALQVGDRISVKAVASQPEEKDGYNEKLSLLSENIFVVYSSGEESELDNVSFSDEKGIELFFPKLNNRLSSILTRTIKGDAGDISSALLLGNRNLLPYTITRDFRRAGASHLLALSGLHMSLIMGAAMLLLKQFIHKNTHLAVLLSCFAVFYLALTGFSISATRSVIMLLIVYLSIMVSGLPDSLTSLSIAGFIIVLVSPGAIVDAGFWMSFAATLGILVYMPPINEFFNQCLAKYDNKVRWVYHKIIFSIISSIATALSALIPLTVVMCIFIKEISVFSILSSVVLSIPTAVIIIASFILLPLYRIPFISDFIVQIIRFTSSSMVDYCEKASDCEHVVVSLNYPFAALMAAVLCLTLFISFASKRFNPFLTLTPFALAVAVFIGMGAAYERINMENLKVAYINVSSVSDMIVISNEREAVICDISNGSQTSYQYALDELREMRATEIKAIMLTRYTHQHNATLYRVFRNYKVRSIWLPYPQNIDDYYKMETLYKFADDNNVSVYVYRDGETLMPFEHTHIEHSSEYIERSQVPIDLISVYTGRERLTYVSPAFNESVLYEEAEFAFSKSQYVVIGSRGPQNKIPYTISNINRLETVTFANEENAAYFTEPKFSFTAYYIVPQKGEMDYYLPE
jgi:ComEC/Rec2-related protein